MNKYTVFNEYDQKNIERILTLTGGEEKHFDKGEVILSSYGGHEEAGIMRKGLAYLLCVNDLGSENILEYYEAGNTFGDILSPHTNVNLYYITAKTKCSVFMIHYRNIWDRLDLSEPSQRLFLQRMMCLPAKKKLMHIDILSQRSIRSKLVTFFSYLREEQTDQPSGNAPSINENTASGPVTLRCPMPLSDLADYLCTDRSAMMRELKKMNTDNIIRSHGQIITLL